MKYTLGMVTICQKMGSGKENILVKRTSLQCLPICLSTTLLCRKQLGIGKNAFVTPFSWNHSQNAGNQGKHVPGHKNYDPEKSSWKEGENGVRQTQEAWKNSKPHPKKKNTRIGVSNDGRTIEIKFGKKGIHGYPIFP